MIHYLRCGGVKAINGCSDGARLTPFFQKDSNEFTHPVWMCEAYNSGAGEKSEKIEKIEKDRSASRGGAEKTEKSGNAIT